MEEHISNISKILKDFLSENHIPILGLTISGRICPNIFEELRVEHPLFFDNYKVSEKKAIGRKIHHLIQQYLIENKIKNSVYIEPNAVHGRVDGLLVYMKAWQVIKD